MDRKCNPSPACLFLKWNALWYPLRFQIIISRVLAHCAVRLSKLVCSFLFYAICTDSESNMASEKFYRAEEKQQSCRFGCIPQEVFFLLLFYHNGSTRDTKTISHLKFALSFLLLFIWMKFLRFIWFSLLSLATGSFIVCLFVCSAQALLIQNCGNRENSLAKFIVQLNCVMEFFSLQHFNARVFFCLFVCRHLPNTG